MDTRKSPIQSATLYKVGTKKKGLDGNIWIIKETVNKTKRWVKYKVSGVSTKKDTKSIEPINKLDKLIKPKGKKYLTHDNGGRPFQVIIDKNNVSVYRLDNKEIEENNDKINKESYKKLVKNFTVEKVYIGKDSKYGKEFDGNSILLELPGNKLIFIGECIYEFELVPGDSIQKYFSQVGNSDVPYPVLLGKNNFYSMIEKQYCCRTEFPTDYKVSDYEGAHGYFYGTFTKKGWVSPIKKIKKLPKLKIIQKKLW